MNYEEWSNQYLLQANIVKNYISLLKVQLKGKNSNEIKDLNYRISILYNIYLELKNTGNFLKSCRKRETNVKKYTLFR